MPQNKSKAPVVFESVSHPILQSLDQSDVVSFILERDIYEIEVTEGEQDGSHMAPVSYRVSVDPFLLRSVHLMCYFCEIVPNGKWENIDDNDIKFLFYKLYHTDGTNEPNSDIY